MARRTFIIEITLSISDFTTRSLVSANIISVVFSSFFRRDVKLCADAILLEESTSSSLEFGNFIPDSRVSVSSKIRGGCWDLAFIGMG